MITDKKKVPAFAEPLTAVNCQPSRKGCEGKARFLCHVVLLITAPRGLCTSIKHQTNILDVCVLEVDTVIS